jgi:hypothetical protein
VTCRASSPSITLLRLCGWFKSTSIFAKEERAQNEKKIQVYRKRDGGRKREQVNEAGSKKEGRMKNRRDISYLAAAFGLVALEAGALEKRSLYQRK